ncbi:MAG: amine dehydrogenase large subunit, partial [Pseudomonadota bacterium]
MRRSAACAAVLLLAACDGGGGSETAAPSEQAAEAPAEPEGPQPALSPEPIPNVLTLPADYPDTWFFAHDLNFNNALDGKIVILDAAAETRAYKGQLPSGVGTFAWSEPRGELYVAETLHELRVRGERRDILVIYDTETLLPLTEVELPPKRYQGSPYKTAFMLTRNDKFALIYNFTPAASVTVVDLDTRAVASEIPIPGCAMIFPTGASGFSTVCGDGGLTTVTLDEAGAVAAEAQTDAFIDIDDDAMSLMSAEID